MTLDTWRIVTLVGATVVAFACTQVSDGWRWYKQLGLWLGAWAVYLIVVAVIERVFYP